LPGTPKIEESDAVQDAWDDLADPIDHVLGGTPCADRDRIDEGLDTLAAAEARARAEVREALGLLTDC
jgi:hypothetical protein